jgi:hypothetical protein
MCIPVQYTVFKKNLEVLLILLLHTFIYCRYMCNGKLTAQDIISHTHTVKNVIHVISLNINYTVPLNVEPATTERRSSSKRTAGK